MMCAYKETIRQVVQKSIGNSDFKGVSLGNAFCGGWDIRFFTITESKNTTLLEQNEGD